MNLTFDNAMTYNVQGSVVYDMTKELKTKFEDNRKQENDRQSLCPLQMRETSICEPPVFFCNGMNNCASKRIPRNSHFYSGGNNQYYWCNQCFIELDEKSPIELIDLAVAKSDMKKKKKNEMK